MDCVNYGQIRRQLQPGDLVFFRALKFSRKNIRQWLLTWYAAWRYHSHYWHVGLIDMVDGVPYVVSLTPDGGASEPLQSVVAQYDVDIYRVNRTTHARLTYDAEQGCVASATCGFDGAFVLMRMWDIMDKKSSLSRRTISFRKLCRRDIWSNDESLLKAVTAAGVIEYAYNEAGYDLCPRTSPNYATPGTLAQSALIDYLFTVTAQ